MTFFRLHSVGWLHENFQSENVLLFEEPNDDAFSLGDPYLCGFDFSRQDMPYELTDRVPSQLQYQHLALDRSLYQHPDLQCHTQQDPEEDVTVLPPRYRKRHDIYSLGVVLMEIGLWCPARKLCKEPEPSLEFHTRLLSELLPELRYRMGKGYHDVVARCLKGQFGDSDGLQSEEPSSSEDHQKQSRRWLESFLRDAVEVLERIVL